MLGKGFLCSSFWWETSCVFLACVVTALQEVCLLFCPTQLSLGDVQQWCFQNVGWRQEPVHYTPPSFDLVSAHWMLCLGGAEPHRTGQPQCRGLGGSENALRNAKTSCPCGFPCPGSGHRSVVSLPSWEAAWVELCCWHVQTSTRVYSSGRATHLYTSVCGCEWRLKHPAAVWPWQIFPAFLPMRQEYVLAGEKTEKGGGRSRANQCGYGFLLETASFRISKSSHETA